MWVQWRKRASQDFTKFHFVPGVLKGRYETMCGRPYGTDCKQATADVPEDQKCSICEAAMTVNQFEYNAEVAGGERYYLPAHTATGFVVGTLRNLIGVY